ncbi:MAG: methyl-accepting chemotaxis protein [Alphaproteobacteria bacterium]|nr:methyl-accepting chemotaxis protein [Alphaproteobacteria bacterium]
MANLKTYQAAFEKIEAVCERAAEGDLEARIIEIEEFGELAGCLNAINRLLDLTDAYVRESSASLEYASQRKYFRPFLLRGMLGDFRRGAAVINAARESMEKRHLLTEEFQSAVSTVVSTVSNAAGELKTTAEAMSNGAETTHQESESVAKASEEGATNAQGVAASAEELTASIAEIARQVTDSMEATGAVVEEVKRATEAVDMLTGAATKIDNVMSFIRDVAGQTNLLALNATIEAARAGEAGRGFSVVASEVKGLATQVAEAAADITQHIQAMQEATDLTAKAIDSINTRTLAVSEVSTAISSAIEEQSAATNEIGQNVQRAAEGSQSISRNIVNITEASERTGNAAKEVLQSADYLASEADGLNDRVETFLKQLSAT